MVKTQVYDNGSPEPTTLSEHSSNSWPVTRAAQTSTREPDDLVEALMDLHHVRSTAEEDGYTLPPLDAVMVAGRALRAMYRRAPRWYGVYPMLDGEIVIDAPTPSGTKVVVVFYRDGTIRCSTLIDGKHSHQVYPDPLAIPDEFMLSALRRTHVLSHTATMQAQEDF